MTSAAEMVLENALRLSVEERSRIAARLIESVDEGYNVEFTPEWQVEIQHRMESIHNGTAKLIPHDQVMDELRQKLREQRVAKPL